MEITPQPGTTEPDPDQPWTPQDALGPYIGRGLGDHFDLTRFGVAMDILPPGSKSALRHWHQKSDEFVLLLEGTLILVTDEGESELTAGMVAGFKAGDANAHHFVNHSDAPAKLLIIGSRERGDAVHYPDDDLQWLRDEDGRHYAARKDGTRY